jgi:hypothetical protein
VLRPTESFRNATSTGDLAGSRSIGASSSLNNDAGSALPCSNGLRREFTGLPDFNGQSPSAFPGVAVVFPLVAACPGYYG